MNKDISWEVIVSDFPSRQVIDFVNSYRSLRTVCFSKLSVDHSTAYIYTTGKVSSISCGSSSSSVGGGVGVGNSSSNPNAGRS